MNSVIVLFDLDGTLVLTGGAGRRAMNRAFDTLHQRGDACASFDFEGMTDRAIVRTGLQVAGITDSEHAIDELLNVYLQFLVDEVAASEKYVVLPGVSELVSALQRHSHVAVGLGTGNVRRGAEIKLERAGLSQSFSFGGYGCDGEDRAFLLNVGAFRGAQRLNVAQDQCRVVVIGDTPRDINAAKAIGAFCIAVATGSHSKAALESYGADVGVNDLQAPRVLSAILERGA